MSDRSVLLPAMALGEHFENGTKQWEAGAACLASSPGVSGQGHVVFALLGGRDIGIP